MKKILIVVLIAMVLVGAGVLVAISSGITGMVASGWSEVANYCNHHDCGHGDGDCDKDEDCVIGEDMFCLQLTRGVIQNRDPSKILAAERANYRQYLQKPYYSDSTDICISKSVKFHKFDVDEDYVIDSIELGAAISIFEHDIIDLTELLRVIQFYNSDGYEVKSGTEDGFAPVNN